MKKKAYVKNQIQIIKKTKARFLSIFCIVFLGAAFFAGLRHAPLIMDVSMNDYLVNYHYNDLDYIATLGFKQSDVDLIKQLDEVENVESGYRFDVLMSCGDQSRGMTVYSNASFENKVNKVELVAGRLPANDHECIIDNHYVKHNNIDVGDAIILTNDNSSKKFTIVGIVNDPRYISTFDRGTNTLGDGTNSGYLEILSNGNESLALPQDLYDLRKETVFNEIRVTLKNPDNLRVFSDDYLDYLNSANKKIKTVLNKEITLLNDELLGEADDKIANGEAAISDGEAKYNDGINQYNDGLAKYQDGLKQYEEGLAKYQDGYKQYQAGLAKYNDGKAQYDQGVINYNQGVDQYQNGIATYNQNVTDYEKLQQQYQQLSSIYQQKQKEYDDAISAGVPAEALTELKSFIDESQSNLAKMQVGLVEYESKLPQAKATLDQTANTLNASKAKLDSTQTTLSTSKKQLDESKATLDSSKQQLDSSKITLDDSKTILDQTKIELDNALNDLNQAKLDLEKGKKDLKDIPTSKLVTLTRKQNSSIINFIGACDSISAIAMVFPLIFFLVAALVSLTTMTRMVEEQRVQSGTFRALGYEKKDVIRQYLIYAFLATFIACCLGSIAGVFFFPNIIYYLYHKMMFAVGAPIHIVFDALICIQTFAISVAITLLVTYIVVRREVDEMPASLLRPKAPKMGKRIILERIPWIWNHLSFNQKVTMRNIFRYKKRFFMSIIGIAGCAALIVTGFGIQGSVSALADKQYGEVWTYDGLVNFDSNLNETDLTLAKEDFGKQKEIAQYSSFYRKTITAVGNKDYYGTLEVYKNNQELSEFANLMNFEGNNQIKLNDEGVIISSKLSELLDISSGDKIKLKIGDDTYQVKVTGIMTFYFGHHIYMSDTLYEKLTDEKPIANYAYFNFSKQGNQTDLDKYGNQNDKITSINYVAGISQGFRDQMGSIDSIVVILIVCAGALAFIVLYNLTNINIQERKSEIATIKVLGFYPREVYDYVFRENRILAIVGSIVGLGLGKLLHMFIIAMVEIETAMFVRSVSLRSYIYAIVITMLFTSLINFVMRKVLKKIDMVESLKSIE